MSGGNCGDPKLIPHKLCIYYYGKDGRKHKFKKYISLYNTTKKDENGYDAATIGRNWCIENGYTYIEIRLDQGEY